MTTQRSPGLFRRLAHGSLVKQILVGLVLGILLAWISKPAAEAVGLLGTLFVGALKAVAPILVLMLVMASIANHQHGQKTNIRPILFLYLLGTFSAALAAVVFSFAFPSTLHLSSSAGDISPPSGIVEVMRGLVMSMVSNPIDALLKGNYIGILVWAIGLGFALRHGNETTKNLVNDMSNAVTFMVKLVIRFAPIGIFGLVSSTLATTGFSTLWGYAQLLVVLVGCMLLVQHGNGDCCARHIDGGTQRNRNGIGIAIQIQLFTQCHIHRNVRRRAAGEEGIHAAFAQAQQHQRERVTTNFPPHQQWVNHQRHQ